MVSFSLKAERFVGLVVVVFVMLLIGHGLGLAMTYGLGHPSVFGLVPLFNIAVEQNVPTLFATLLLFANGLLFLVLSRVSDQSPRMRRVWLVLAVTFCFLAVDESVALHERLIQPVRQWLDVGGYLFFAWVIPYAAAVAILGAFVAAPLWSLGWRYRLLFGAAGLAYLGGAIGIEMIGARYFEANHEQVDLAYRLFQTLEECLEFAGLIVLVYTLLDLIRKRTHAVTVRLL